MDYLIALLCLGLVPILAFLARLTSAGLPGRALHPFNILGLLIAVFVLDFLTLIGDTSQGQASQVLNYLITSEGQVRQGVFFLLLCCIALAVGVAVAVVGRRPSPKPAMDPAAAEVNRRAASAVMLIVATLTVIFAGVIISIAASEGSVFHIAGTRTSFFRENPQLAILSALGLPAFYLYGSSHGLSRGTAVYAAIMLICFIPIGSRSMILALFIGLAFWAAQRFRIALPTVYLSLPPLAIFIAIYRYFTRDAYTFASFDQLVNYYGGYFGLLFRTPDISLAEVVTVGVSYEPISRNPLDSLIGFVTAPIPRSFIPWKPYGVSSEFTRFATPDHWELFGSETTITGFINLLLEFGYVGGLVILALLAWFWTRSWVIRAGDPVRMAFTGPVLIMIAYTFCRSDLYNVALFVWPMLFVLLLHAMLRRLFGNRLGGPAIARRGSPTPAEAPRGARRRPARGRA